MRAVVPTRSGSELARSPRWMQVSGLLVLVAVLVLLSFVLPPLFDTAGPEQPGGAPVPHSPPAGGHAPTSTGAP